MNTEIKKITEEDILGITQTAQRIRYKYSNSKNGVWMAMYMDGVQAG